MFLIKNMNNVMMEGSVEGRIAKLEGIVEELLGKLECPKRPRRNQLQEITSKLDLLINILSQIVPSVLQQ